MALLDILIVIALGTLSGTILGLAIGFLARRQEVPWPLMSPTDKKVNIGLIVLFSGICTAGFAWYAFL
jgi:ABC-type phosphate/phosphonate transport system permease subunit